MPKQLTITYIANIRLPTEKAHGIQIMKTCEALVSQGTDVELVVPKRHNTIKEDPFDFYGGERNFTIKRLWSLDAIWWSMPAFLKKIAFWKQSAAFAFNAWRYIKKSNPSPFRRGQGEVLIEAKAETPSPPPPIRGRTGDLVLYTRDLFLALILPKENLFYEVHWLPEKVPWYHKRAYKRAKGLIVISDGIKNDLIKLGISETKICVARDAVERKQFQLNITKEGARKKIGLPTGQKIVVYTGHLYDWKGANVLAEAVRLLSADIQVYLVGGINEDVKRFKAAYQLPNLHIVGWRKHEEIPFWLRAADTLVLPNSAKSRIGAQDTSPLKLFEYMMAGRPIVAADLPAIREVLTEDMAELVKPDDPARLALGIKAALERKELSANRVAVAQEKVRDCTWDKRAKQIIDFIFVVK